MSTSDLKAFIDDMLTQHAGLSSAFESAQADARSATARCREARDRLTAFRQEFGGYLKLADQGSITVEE